MTQTWHITGQELWSKVDSMAHTWPSPLGHHFAWNSYTSVYSSLCTAVSKHLYPGATPASFSRGLENKLILITELKLRVGGNYFQNCQSPPAILSVTPKKLEEVKWSIHLAKWERPIWTILFTGTYQKLFVIYIPGLRFFLCIHLLNLSFLIFKNLVYVSIYLGYWKNDHIIRGHYISLTASHQLIKMGNTWLSHKQLNRFGIDGLALPLFRWDLWCTHFAWNSSIYVCLFQPLYSSLFTLVSWRHPGLSRGLENKLILTNDRPEFFKKW